MVQSCTLQWSGPVACKADALPAELHPHANTPRLILCGTSRDTVKSTTNHPQSGITVGMVKFSTLPELEYPVDMAENYSHQDMRGKDLSGKDLRGVDASYCHFEGANLEGANLSSGMLYGAYLTGANLTRARLRYVNITYGELAGANLTEADLTGSILTGANMEGTILTGAILTDMIGYQPPEAEA